MSAREQLDQHPGGLDHRSPATRGKGGSVLAIVLVMMMLTAFVLMIFIDKASTDLIVESRVVEAQRLRQEAYSALEVTLAVLENFRAASNGLHSPAEGWNDPLTFAAWEPGNGHTVEIAFEDESGKISLPRIDAAKLIAFFQSWEMPQADAEKLADALMNWMKKDYMTTGAFTPEYDRAAIPYAPPGRSLRSFDELAAIDVARDVFYGDDGRPNELWHRFADSFSLYSFQRPNLNAARPDVLGALAGLDVTQQQNLADYVSGGGAYQARGPGFFQSMADAAPIVGPGDLSGFGTTISALRIRVTVHDGLAVYRLNTVVAPPNGAQVVRPPATNNAANGPAGATPNPTPTPTRSTANAGAAAKKLNYPFTVLEIRENDEPLPTTPPPEAPPNA
jgi:hypothetical protein